MKFVTESTLQGSFDGFRAVPQDTLDSYVFVKVSPDQTVLIYELNVNESSPHAVSHLSRVEKAVDGSSKVISIDLQCDVQMFQYIPCGEVK